jgi:phosphoenolpyruvate carboxylase
MRSFSTYRGERRNHRNDTGGWPNAGKWGETKRKLKVEPMEKEKTTIDFVNEELIEKEITLHPTKGFRRTTVKRSRIAFITQQRKVGIKLDTLQMLYLIQEGM